MRITQVLGASILALSLAACGSSTGGIQPSTGATLDKAAAQSLKSDALMASQMLSSTLSGKPNLGMMIGSPLETAMNPGDNKPCVVTTNDKTDVDEDGIPDKVRTDIDCTNPNGSTKGFFEKLDKPGKDTGFSNAMEIVNTNKNGVNTVKSSSDLTISATKFEIKQEFSASSPRGSNSFSFNASYTPADDGNTNPFDKGNVVLSGSLSAKSEGRDYSLTMASGPEGLTYESCGFTAGTLTITDSKENEIKITYNGCDNEPETKYNGEAI
jgi:hypothetical protein